MDQTDKLIIDVQGKEKIESLNQQLVKEEQALKALATALREGTISQAQFDQAAKQSAQAVLGLQAQIKELAGRSGMSGSGILQASYAVQDFTSVLSGGQGLARALSSVQNNIPGLLMALGASGGLAGIVSLVSVGIGALIPVVEKLWESLSSDVPKEAKEKLETLKRAAEETHKAFQALTETPTDYESQSAKAIHDFLGRRPNAEIAKEALIAGMGRKSTQEALTEAGTRPEWGLLGPAAEMSDAEIERRAQQAAFAGAGVADRTRARLMQERETAQQKRFTLEKAAKEGQAEKIIQGAQVAGPAGADMRRRLLAATKGHGGLEDLQAMSPERLEQDEQEGNAEYDAAVESGQNAHEAGQRRRKQAAKQKRQAKEAERQAKHDAAQAKHDAAQAKHDAAQAKHAQDVAGRTEEHRVDAALRRSARERADLPHAQAEQAVTRFSEQIGRETGGQFGGTPTAQQADQMADQALRLMQQGMSGQQAVFQSVMAKLRSIVQAQQEANAQQAQQMQMMGGQMNAGFQMFGGQGPDYGQFSMLPPIW